MAGHAEQSEANAITQNSGDSGLSQSVSNAEMSNFSSVREQMTTHSADLHNVEIEGLNNNSNGTTGDAAVSPSGAPNLTDNSGQNQMLTSETAVDGPNGEATDPNRVNPDGTRPTENPGSESRPGDRPNPGSETRPDGTTGDPTTEPRPNGTGQTDSATETPRNAQPKPDGTGQPNDNMSPGLPPERNSTDPRSGNEMLQRNGIGEGGEPNIISASATSSLNETGTVATNSHSRDSSPGNLRATSGVTDSSPTETPQNPQNQPETGRTENERSDGGSLMAENPQDRPTNNPPRAGAEPAEPRSPEGQNDQATTSNDGTGPVNQNPRPEQTEVPPPSSNLTDGNNSNSVENHNNIQGNQTDRAEAAAEPPAQANNRKEGSSPEASEPERQANNSMDGKSAESSEPNDTLREQEDNERRAREGAAPRPSAPRPNFGNSTISGDIDA